VQALKDTHSLINWNIISQPDLNAACMAQGNIRLTGKTYGGVSAMPEVHKAGYCYP
jgi:hypothetical protein